MRSLPIVPLLLVSLAPAQDCKTTLFSVDTGGGRLGWGASAGGNLSDDGRRIAFYNWETGLPGSPAHAYVRDNDTGITTPIPGAAYADDISGDGRVVVCEGTGLTATDLQLGTTVQVDVDLAGQIGGGMWGRISADGRFVAFMCASSNLVPGDTNGVEDIFVRDLVAGTTERVSVSSSGAEGDHASWLPPAISADGRYVAFSSLATNFAPGDANAEWDIFVHDRTTGTTELVSRALSGGTGNGISEAQSISADGRFVAFDSLATDLVSSDVNGDWDAFVRDTQLGTTRMIDVNLGGGQPHADSYSGPLSGDGRLCVFTSRSTRIVQGDSNRTFDVFVRDLVTGSVERVSLGSEGQESPSSSFAIDMTPDGRFVTFSSAALTPPGTTGGLYVRGCPQSVARYGQAKPNSAACRPWISWTGAPSASAGSGFVLRAQNELNRHVGRLLYGLQAQWYPKTIPYLVVAPPLRRLPLARTGGSPTGTDCSGALELDFNAWIAQGSDPALVPGTTVFGQFWASDGGFAPPDDYGLSDAIDFTIQP